MRDGALVEVLHGPVDWEVVPSGYELQMLSQVDVCTLDADGVCAHLARVKAHEGLVAALLHAATARLVDLVPEAAPEALAATVNETTNAAARACLTSWRLMTHHGSTVAGLRDGSVGPRHATVLERETRHLPDEVTHAVDTQIWAVLPEVADPVHVARKARALALDLDPTSAKERVARNRGERRVELGPGPQGTTWFSVLMATEDAMAFQDEVNRATAIKDPEDPRTRPQRQADLVVERLTGRPPLLVADDHWVQPPTESPAESPESSAVPAETCTDLVPVASQRARKVRDRRVEVGVLIGLDVLLGLQDGHATIDGEPLPTDVARGLLCTSDAVLRRLVTDPLTGHLLDLAKDTYKPAPGCAASSTPATASAGSPAATPPPGAATPTTRSPSPAAGPPAPCSGTSASTTTPSSTAQP